MVEKTDFGEK